MALNLCLLLTLVLMMWWGWRVTLWSVLSVIHFTHPTVNGPWPLCHERPLLQERVVGLRNVGKLPGELLDVLASLSTYMAWVDTGPESHRHSPF